MSLPLSVSAEPSVHPTLMERRHSCAHLLAAAVQDLFPGSRFGTGPATEDGFFYDIETPRPVLQEDLHTIEKQMRKIQGRRHPLKAEVWSSEHARAWMAERGQVYKVDLIDRLGVPEVSIYRLGDFVDLCRGPHIAEVSQIGVFKLMSLAGAYWRGDASGPQLTRIRGLCFASQEQLDHRLWELEEARRRDHRGLGRDLGIFAMSDDVGQGLPLWLPDGTTIRLELEHLAREYEGRAGYQAVVTPPLAKESLYLRSGHLSHYKEDMYAPIEIDDQRYYLRPMCCPHHHQIFLARPRSYREMPLRIAEFGQVFRFEASGALSGLMRTRGFCQNDAHLYVREDQILDEFVKVMKLHARYYDLFGIKNYFMRLSLPDFSAGSGKYVDDVPAWEHAIGLIRQAMVVSGLPFVEAPGEAAFYGPKIDFMIKSAIGQSYAISTNQLDFIAARRFALEYTGEDGGQHPVYVIHRAPLGSHERFTAFLLEHFAGALPLWLAPQQVVIIPVSDRHTVFARQLLESMQEERYATFNGCLRTEIDESSERMQKKIMRARQRKVPYMIVVGDKEADGADLAVRLADGSSVALSKHALLDLLKSKILKRDLN